MTTEPGSGPPSERRSPLVAAFRWCLAAMIVVTLHGLGAWAAFEWQPADAMPNDAPPTVMIDLAPVAVAPAAPEQDIAPGPQMVEAQPAETPDPIDPIEERSEAPTESQETVEPVEQTEEVAPEPVAEPLEKVPELTEQDKAEAILAPIPTPSAKPRVERKPPRKKEQAERKKPVMPDQPRHQQTTAPPTAQAKRAEAAAAPVSGASNAPSTSPATWRGLLSARLNRFKRYPRGASGHGTASIAFTMDRSGRIISARLIGSSGDPVLDAEAVSLPKRASPLPPPPAGLGSSNFITLTVPVRFDR